MTTYQASQVLTSFTYHIGSADAISGQYSFDEDKPCGYEETVTIEGLPDFISHNAASSDFTIATNSDLGLIGSYTVTVKSQIVIPDGASPQILSDDFTFTVLVEPCLVETFTPINQITEIIYHIGEPDLTDGQYDFQQSPSCNYDQIITVSSVPQFVTHNESAGDFSIP